MLATLTSHSGSVMTCRWSTNGRYLASGADDNMVLIYELRPQSEQNGEDGFGGGLSGATKQVRGGVVCMSVYIELACFALFCFVLFFSALGLL